MTRNSPLDGLVRWFKQLICRHDDTLKKYSDEWAGLSGEYARKHCVKCGKLLMRYFHV